MNSINVGDSTVFVPPGFDPEEPLGRIIVDKLSTEVPVNNIEVTLTLFLKIAEATSRLLEGKGQPGLAWQILPRGGNDA